MAIELVESTAGQEIPLGYFVDSTDANTEETALTIANTDIKIWKAGATTLASKNSGGATHISNGVYYCVLDATDTNTVGPLVVFVHVTGALPVRVECVVRPSTGLPVNTTHFGGTAGTFSGGRPEVNTTHAAGTAWASGAITAASIATGAIDADAIADGAIDAGAIAADAITAAKIAAGAIDAATFAADTGLVPARSNTAQAGAAGTVTLDASASATTDFYVGMWVYLTGGTGAGQARVVTAYNGTTKVATVAPNWATNPDATSTFAVVPAAHITGVQGNVTGSVASVTGAVGSVTGNVGGNVTGSVGSVATGGIAAASFAAGAIDAAAIAANAIGASELAADAVAEIADAVWDEALAGHAAAGSAGEALEAAGTAGDPWTTALPGAYGAGTAGKIIGDNINATISSRASQTSLDTVDDFLDTEIAAIKAKTDSLTFTVAGQVDANAVAISGDSVAADNLEAATDGTGYNVGNGSVVAASVTGAVGSVTGNVGGNVTGSVGSVAAGGIAAASFAAGAIDAAAIAADAIGASELAADAANEIADALLGRNVAGGSSAGRLVKEALYLLRNKTAVAAGTLTVYATDDTTSAWTAAVGTTAGDPISSVDPA